MRRAGDDTEAHQGGYISVRRHDNWDCLCRTLGCVNSRCVGHDYIDVQCNQLGRENWEAILMSLCRT